MDHFSENLLNVLDAAASEDQVFAALAQAALDLGFEYCSYVLSLAPVSNRKVLVLSNYPRRCQQRYADGGFVAVDPSVRHGLTWPQPLVWSDAFFAPTPDLWEEAKGEGLRIGWAQASHDGLGARGLLSLARSGDALSTAELQEKDVRLRWIVHAGQMALSRPLRQRYVGLSPAPLTTRELEVLRWTADGKTAGEIADILCLSAATVNYHLKGAIAKLKVANKTAAVVQALLTGLI